MLPLALGTGGSVKRFLFYYNAARYSIRGPTYGLTGRNTNPVPWEPKSFLASRRDSYDVPVRQLVSCMPYLRYELKINGFILRNLVLFIYTCKIRKDVYLKVRRSLVE